MGKISRRIFLRDSLIFASSSLFISSKYLQPFTKASLQVSAERLLDDYPYILYNSYLICINEEKKEKKNNHSGYRRILPCSISWLC